MSNDNDKVEFIPLMCPMLKREIDFGYCTEIEYVALGIVNPDFLVDGDNISQETATKHCIGCQVKKNKGVQRLVQILPGYDPMVWFP